MQAGDFAEGCGQSCELSVNISRTERAVSFGGGTLLLGAGIRRGGGLGLLATMLGGGLLFRAVTGHCAVKAARENADDPSQARPVPAIKAKAGVHAQAKVLINKPAPELFTFWKEASNLPRILRHVTSVSPGQNGRTRWTANGLWGELNWETEVITERENELLAWRSIPGGDLDTAGSIAFKPSGARGTAVTLTVKYDPPGGKLADYVASFLGNGLDDQIHDDLFNFKRLSETGELPRIKGDDFAEVQASPHLQTSN